VKAPCEIGNITNRKKKYRTTQVGGLAVVKLIKSMRRFVEFIIVF
jgi:hypothetical protein